LQANSTAYLNWNFNQVHKKNTKPPTGFLPRAACGQLSKSLYTITLENLRIRADFLDEAQPLIQAAIDQSSLLKQISAAAFRKQDISEFDRLALELKEQINRTSRKRQHSHYTSS